MKTGIFSFAICTGMLFLACSDKDESLLLTPDAIQGLWEEQHEGAACSYGCVSHEFVFNKNNTFLMFLQRTTDTIDTLQACPGNRNNYGSGSWEVDGYFIRLDGIFTDKDYSTPAPDCIDGPEWNLKSPYEFDGKTLLIRRPANEGGDIRLLKH